MRQNVHGVGWRTVTETSPSFTQFSGGLADQELTRAAVERFATACSRLKPEATGNPDANVRRLVETRPNPLQSWPKFLKRLAAIYETRGTAFVVPSYAADMRTVKGLWPMLASTAEVVEYAGEPWLRFGIPSGGTGAYRLAEVCVLTKFPLESDIFGEPNCLGQTMRLIHAQAEAQDAAIKNGARVRFIGAVNSMARPEDLVEKRRKFMEDNFGAENNGGMLVYDSSFTSVKQVEPQSYLISDKEMERIEAGVCNYFGISRAVLQSDFTEEQWDAWYESRVEPFAIELGEALTAVLYGDTAIQHGKRVEFSSNRLEYASSAAKRNMVRDMVDRGVMSLNEARQVLQLPPIEGGDIRVIRGEYVDADTVASLIEQAAVAKGGGRMPKNVSDKNGEIDLNGDDDFYADSDAYGKDDFD